MVIYNVSRCDRDAAICQSCSCWCSCCASGCSYFCSRCLRGLLCFWGCWCSWCCSLRCVSQYASMLRLLLCCSYCLNVVASAWTLNQVDAAAQHSPNRAPALTYTVFPHSPLFKKRKTNIAKRTWKLICCSYCWVALGLCSLYFGSMLAHLGTMLALGWVLLSCLGPMLGFVGSNAAPHDAAICQSCSCWCSCCASGCSYFCSRCLRGLLCFWGCWCSWCCSLRCVSQYASMLRLLLCCSYCLNVVASAWTLNQVDAAAQHSPNRAPALTYTVFPHSPLFKKRKTNIAKRTWKLICCSYCWVALGLCSLYFGSMLAHLGTMLALGWVLLSCLGPMLGFVGSNAAPHDAAICQSCSCWCSCCASGCSCFCSRCLRGCCDVEVVDVVGAILCGASRKMLVCSVCCFVARTVSAWTLNQVDAAAKHSSNRAPALTYTVLPPLPPLQEEEN